MRLAPLALLLAASACAHLSAEDGLALVGSCAGGFAYGATAAAGEVLVEHTAQAAVAPAPDGGR
jgi:hypothetical protein